MSDINDISDIISDIKDIISYIISLHWNDTIALHAVWIVQSNIRLYKRPIGLHVILTLTLTLTWKLGFQFSEWNGGFCEIFFQYLNITLLVFLKQTGGTRTGCVFTEILSVRNKVELAANEIISKKPSKKNLKKYCRSSTTWSAGNTFLAILRFY